MTGIRVLRDGGLWAPVSDETDECTDVENTKNGGTGSQGVGSATALRSRQLHLAAANRMMEARAARNANSLLIPAGVDANTCLSSAATSPNELSGAITHYAL